MTVINDISGYECTLTIGSVVGNIETVDYKPTMSEVVNTVRAHGGNIGRRPGEYGWEATVSMIVDPADTLLGSLYTAFLNRTELTANFDGTTQLDSSGKCYIFEMPRSEPLNDAVKVTLTLKSSGN